MTKKDKVIGPLCALGCETLFGLSYIVTKEATQTAGAFALLGWRFLIAFIAMSLCAVCGFIQLDLRGKSIKPLLLVAIFSPCLYFTGETIGVQNTSASESGVFLACIPVVSLMASTLILKKKPSKMQVAGILTTLVGVVMTVFSVGSSSSLSAVGYAFLSIAVLAYALYSVFVEKASDHTGAEVTFFMLMAGAIMFGAIAVCEGLSNGRIGDLLTLPFKEKTFALAILYQGIGCSMLGFLLSNIAIAKIGVNRTASFVGVATVVSIIAGILILKEPFSVYQLIGAVTIVAGVYMANHSLSG